jgi:hypothetical protein
LLFEQIKFALFADELLPRALEARATAELGESRKRR